MTPLRGPLRKRKSHLWERDKNDFYVEPFWVSERLFAVEKFIGRVDDPSCGTGRILKAAINHNPVRGGDIVDRCKGRYGDPRDFLSDDYSTDGVNNIVSNPPFKLCNGERDYAYVRKALTVAKRKVALLLPSNWIQGDRRSRFLETTPLQTVYWITPRPSMPPGAAILAGQKPGNGTTDYAWFVFERGYTGRPQMGWIRRDA